MPEPLPDLEQHQPESAGKNDFAQCPNRKLLRDAEKKGAWQGEITSVGQGWEGTLG